MTAEPGSNRPDLPRLIAHYRTMARIRAFERQAEAAAKAGLVTGAVHLSVGQEAVAAAVCGNLELADTVATNHRGHGHTLAKGADPEAMMRELFGRAGGVCGGKGGSMHIADFSVGILGANGIVGAGILIAAGAAHGARLLGAGNITVCLFGDGAVNRGPFLEGLNWAKVFELPILFVCEDNGFAATTRTDAMTAGPGPAARAEALGIPAYTVDGNDLLAIDDLARELIAKVRAGSGPLFLLARTYRLKGHTHADAAAYRPAAEVAAAKDEAPLVRARALLESLGVPVADLDGIAAAAEAEMTTVAEAAAKAPHPPPEDAFRDVQDIGAAPWPS